MNCHVCGEEPASCWCPCPLCGKSSTAKPGTPEACGCAYEDLTVALRASTVYAVAQRALLERVGNVLSTTSADYMPITNAERDELIRDIDAALAKNPNPAGLDPATEASGTPTPDEASGAGRAGTRLDAAAGTGTYTGTRHETGTKPFECCGAGDPPCPSFEASCQNPANYTHETATEQLAAWMIANGFTTGHGDDAAALLQELAWQAKELRGLRHQSNSNVLTEADRLKIALRVIYARTVARDDPLSVEICQIAQDAIDGECVHQVGRNVHERDLLNAVAAVLREDDSSAEPSLRTALAHLHAIHHDYESVACTKQGETP